MTFWKAQTIEIVKRSVFARSMAGGGEEGMKRWNTEEFQRKLYLNTL